jgi:uncharacterized protein (DUF58 family)
MIRPTRTTEAVAALGLALAAIAFIVESPAAALAAGSFGVFILWRAGRFDRNFRALATSLTAKREVSRTIIRQGAAVTVRTRVDCTLPPGMEVRVRDVPPAVATGEAPLCGPGETGVYTIRIMAPGRTAFGGVILSASDPYYSHGLHIRHLNAPGLRVFPVGSAMATSGATDSGMRDLEVDRMAALHGPSVREFRPYRVGDDPGRIDWKMSAKHNVFYVRELTGLRGGTPLVVVDLPTWEETDSEVFARYSMVVTDAVEEAIESRAGCSLLVIAGGEILRFLPRTEDAGEAFTALSGLAPIEPRVPLYRAPGPAVLAARAKLPRGGGGLEKSFLARLGVVLKAFARESRSPFAGAVKEALAWVEATEVHIYTLARGDRSHLAQFIHQAKTKGMRVVVFAPAGTTIPRGVDAVEVI